MHEPELGVDQVEVVVQALALPAEELDGLGLMRRRTWKDMHGSTALMRHTMPSVTPSRSAMDLARSSFCWTRLRGLDVVEGDHRTAGVGGQLAGVVGDALGGGLGVVGEVGERHALGPQEAAGTVLLVERAEMAFEDHPVEHRQAPGDALAVEILERPHDRPPDRSATSTSSVPPSRPLSTGPRSRTTDPRA